jgi:hypothetical protein
MKRVILVLVGLLSAIIGGTVVYFLIAVPRDLKADQLIREARELVKEKKEVEARRKLREVIENYPRTEAGASASAALFEIGERERQTLKKEIEALQTQNAALARRVALMESKAAAPPPKVESPAPPPAPAKKLVIKKSTPKKKAPVRRTTRRRR